MSAVAINVERAETPGPAWRRKSATPFQAGLPVPPRLPQADNRGALRAEVAAHSYENQKPRRNAAHPHPAGMRESSRGLSPTTAGRYPGCRMIESARAESPTHASPGHRPGYRVQEHPEPCKGDTIPLRASWSHFMCNRERGLSMNLVAADVSPLHILFSRCMSPMPQRIRRRVVASPRLEDERGMRT